MEVVITCTAWPKRTVLIESYELNFNRDDACFWMRLVMGDDWFQRVKSSFDFEPTNFEIFQNEARISFETKAQAQEFEAWLIRANEQVEEGFKTMRG